MNKYGYEEQPTEEDILIAQKKFPLDNFKVTLFMLALAIIMFIIGVYLMN